MKKAALTAAIIAFSLSSAFAQFRFDLGITSPLWARVLFIDENSETQEILDWCGDGKLVLLPDLAFHVQLAVGDVKCGIGARGFSLFAMGFAWPNAYVEFDKGPLAAEAQVGGGALASIGARTPEASLCSTMIFDLSLWWKVGRRRILRLGGGCMGIVGGSDLVSLFEYSDHLKGFPFAAYAGGKVVLER